MKMNRKILFRVIICVLICMCFVVAGNHMPQFMGAVYRAVFGEFDHIALFFVLGVFLLEIITLKRWGNDKRCYYVCLEVAVAAAALVLFHGDTSFVDKLAPGADTTLIGRVVTDDTIDEDNIQAIFAEYYFDNKNVIVSEEIYRNEEYQYLYKMAIPASKVTVGQEIIIEEDIAEKILSYPYKEYGSACYVLDECWENTDHIRQVTWEGKQIFCSEEMLAEGVVYSGEGTDLFGMEGNVSHKEIKQIMIMLLLLLIGCSISLPLWSDRYLYLSFFLGLPVGAAVWCICGVVFMIFNIPYNLISALGCILLFVGIWLFRRRTVLKTLNWSSFLNFIFPAMVVAVFFAYYKACYTSSDSLMKCAYGFRLANYGGIREILADVAPYGILEPMIQSIGYLAGCDALYIFYPLMAICGIGIMCTGLYYISDKKESYISVAVLGAGILLLITNFDYVLSAVVMLAQGPIAVYTLILIMFIVMKRQLDIPGFEGMVTIAATMILLTRVEGAVYVFFFLAVSLGIENASLKMYKVNILVAGVTIVWNVFQIIIVGASADPMFWTPERGIILMVGAVMILAVTWVMHRRWILVDFVKKYFFLLVFSAICAVTVGVTVLMARGIASINLPFFLSHFSNNEGMNARINAGGFWTFVLLLSPIIMRTGNRLARYSITTIGGYLLLIYFVCLFREDVPLHYGYFDSARRTIVQIMPSAVWLLAYCAGIEKEAIN